MHMKRELEPPRTVGPGRDAISKPVSGMWPRVIDADELGYLRFEPQAAHLFFQLVSRRYEHGSILITSNRSVGEWGEVFGDTVVATAILDRLLYHRHVSTTTGESFRLREKRRAGVLDTAPVNRPQADEMAHATGTQKRRDEHRRRTAGPRHP